MRLVADVRILIVQALFLPGATLLEIMHDHLVRVAESASRHTVPFAAGSNVVKVKPCD